MSLGCSEGGVDRVYRSCKARSEARSYVGAQARVSPCGTPVLLAVCRKHPATRIVQRFPERRSRIDDLGVKPRQAHIQAASFPQPRSILRRSPGGISHLQGHGHVSARLHSIGDFYIHLHQPGDLTLNAASILNSCGEAAYRRVDRKEGSNGRRACQPAICPGGEVWPSPVAKSEM